MACSAGQPVIWLSARLKTVMRSSGSRIMTPSALCWMIATSSCCFSRADLLVELGIAHSDGGLIHETGEHILVIRRERDTPAAEQVDHPEQPLLGGQRQGHDLLERQPDRCATRFRRACISGAANDPLAAGNRPTVGQNGAKG